MTLSSSGSISLSQVNVELGRASNAAINMNESAVRALFGKASGAIALSDGYGKSSSFKATISTNQQELNLATWATANGWNGSSAAEITIAAGVYIWSDNTAVAALTTGNFPGGLTLINNGYIMGKGGRGLSDEGGLTQYPNYANLLPQAGGNAIALGCNVSVNNTGFIGGGGGGGGGFLMWSPSYTYKYMLAGTRSGGGGAGGGAGGVFTYGQVYSDGSWASRTPVYGGFGGGIGSVGGNGAVSPDGSGSGSGGGGGRVFPSARTNAVVTTNPPGHSVGIAGLGGSGGGVGGLGVGMYVTNPRVAGYGGGPNEAGGNPSHIDEYNDGAAGGGGWGAPGGSPYFVSTNGVLTVNGASGGKAVALNGKSVTWLSNTNQVYGAVS